MLAVMRFFSLLQSSDLSSCVYENDSQKTVWAQMTANKGLDVKTGRSKHFLPQLKVITMATDSQTLQLVTEGKKRYLTLIPSHFFSNFEALLYPPEFYLVLCLILFALQSETCLVQSSPLY